MKIRVRCALTAILLLAATYACSAERPETSSDTTWVGTITTEGNVTTVVNESGSVWGGNVALVEEASIGVDAGEDAYMLGAVRAVAATDGEIYVLDGQVPALRVYDMSGRHLRDIGVEGSGPAEFRRPDSLVIGPDGRIYVRDYPNARIMVFSPQGQEVGTLPLDGGFATSAPMVMTVDGTLYNYERIVSDDPQAPRRGGLAPRSLEADGTGDPIPRPELAAGDWSLTASGEGMSISMGVPFAPAPVWTVAPSGALIAGVADEYSFDIRYPDGSVTRVVKQDDPVPVAPEEADWHRKSTIARMRRNAPDWNWNGKDIPAVKPAYQRFLPDRSGRVWVTRPGPGTHVEADCNENPEPDNAREDPCWQAGTSWHVFDDEGRFLGGADVPEGIGANPAPFIEGDMFLARVTDDLGTIMVKRYRLVLPGER